MRYSNYNNYNDNIKPYAYDALECYRRLEYETYKNIKNAFIEAYKPVFEFIARQKGEFKGVDDSLSSLIEKAKEELDELLQFCVYRTLQKTASIALSISARLKVDEMLSKESVTLGEMQLQGEAKRVKTTDKNIIVKQIQAEVATKSTEIAKHILEKKRIYREKEFKLSTRLWDTADDSTKTIKKLLEAGINIDCKKLANTLATYLKDGNRKPISKYPNMMKRLGGRFPPSLPFSAMRLARNEQSETFFITSIKDYMENPYVEAVQWLLANNRLKMYEDKCACNDIAYEDVYGLGRGIYPLDKVPDRPHVMCLCTLAPITSRKLKKQLEGKMKLGNVPTEEWLEKQNHENNVNLIKDTERKTGLKLFHNEEGKALGNASIDIIKNHEWFSKGVKEEDKTAFLLDLHKVHGRYLYILAKHTGNMQVDFYSTLEMGTCYDPNINKIFCNLIRDSSRIDNETLGFNLGMKSFLHEAGHWLDNNRYEKIKGLSEKMSYLSDFVQKDVLNYINKIGYDIFKGDYKPIHTINYKTITNLPPEIKNKISSIIKGKQGINSNISDLYGSKTYNIIHGDIGHDWKYWAYDDIKKHHERVIAEAIAEMFESFGNTERIKAMQEFLPLAWNYFNRMLEEVF